MDNACILLVDDEPHVTAALTRTLRKEPYQIYCANSAEQGLELLAQEKVDIVISDENMPGMKGCEFLAEVRRRYPSTIRIVLTGNADLETAIRAINDGEVYRFFTKPCNPEDLKFTLRQSLLQKKLVKQSKKLLQNYKKQSAYLDEVKRSYPGLTDVEYDDQDFVVISDVDAELEDLLKEVQDSFGEV